MHGKSFKFQDYYYATMILSFNANDTGILNGSVSNWIELKSGLNGWKGCGIPRAWINEKVVEFLGFNDSRWFLSQKGGTNGL